MKPSPAGTGTKRRKPRFTITAKVAAEPMSAEEWQAAEGLLARLAARAYAADHPELFAANAAQASEPETPGLPPANAGLDRSTQNGPVSP